MFDILKERDGKLIFTTSSTMWWMGIMFITLGVLMGLLFAVGCYFKEPNGGIAAYFFLIGFPLGILLLGKMFLSCVSPCEFETRTKKLNAYGLEFSFDEISSIMLTSSIVKTRKSEYLSWQMYVTLKSPENDTSEQLQRINDQIQQAFESNVPLSEENRNRIQEQLPKLVEQLKETQIRITNHTYEDQVWRAAQRLAEVLQVPILDCVSDQVQLYPTRYTDAPLAKTLQVFGSASDDKLVPSVELERVSTANQLELTWQHSRWFNILFLGAFTLVFLVGAIVMSLKLLWWTGIFFFVPAMFFVWILTWAGRGHGTNKITINKQSLLYEDSYLFGQRIEIPLSEFQGMRVNHDLHPSLNLLSTQRIVLCFATPEVAQQLKSEIEKFLLQSNFFANN